MIKLEKIYNLSRIEKKETKDNKKIQKWINLGVMYELTNGRKIVKLDHLEYDIFAFEQKGWTKNDKEKIKDKELNN